MGEEIMAELIDIGHPNFDEFGDNNGIGGDDTGLMDTSTWPTFGAQESPPEHSITVLPPTDTPQQLPPQQPQQQQQPQQPQPRNNSISGQVPGLGLYRRQSQRNPRSCDVCRGRKTVCRVEGSLPCMTCRSLRRECTFTERARKKRKTDSQAKAQGRNQDASVNLFEQDDAAAAAMNAVNFAHGNPSPEEDGGIPGLFHSSPSTSPTDFFNLPVDWMSKKANGTANDPSNNSSHDPHSNTNGNSNNNKGGKNSINISHTRSIDLRPSQTSFLLGDTGESDPYLLRRSALAGGPGKEDSDSPISYVQIQTQKTQRQHRGSGSGNMMTMMNGGGGGADAVLDEERPLVFMLIEHSLHGRYEPKVEEEDLQKAHSALREMCSDDIGVRLVKLYFKYVYPYWPVLSRTMMLSSDLTLAENVANLPLSLKAALYAAGLPFMVFDDVLATQLDLQKLSASRLHRICWLAITHEIHNPHLSTVQSCLLLLQRANDDRYVMDSPFRWSLLAWTVSLAQGLGLSTDCSDWLGIPSWEKRLRRRLWWAVFVMDKWCFPSAGLATHVKREDYDTLPLTANDFVTVAAVETSPKDLSSSAAAPPPLPSDLHGAGNGLPPLPSIPLSAGLHEDSHFYHLVELSRITSDILDGFFTIRAASSTRGDFSRTIELARPLRTRLQSWKESFDVFLARRRQGQGGANARNTRLDGNVCLSLSYLVSVMILFRAMLRPLESPAVLAGKVQIEERGREAVRAGAKACCVEVVQFVEMIPRSAWDAHWHSWSRANFATATSFIMRLLLTSTSDMEKRDFHHIISRWRWELRSGGGSAGNVLTSLGLLRLDNWLLKSGIRVATDNDDI